MAVFLSLFFGCAGTADTRDFTEKQKHESVESLKFHENREKDIYVKQLITDYRKEFLRANNLFDTGLQNKAEEIYERIAFEKKDFSRIGEVYFNLGLIKSRKFQWKEASEQFKKAYKSFDKKEDIADAALMSLESMRKSESWEELENTAEDIISENKEKKFLSSGQKKEVEIRYVESIIVKGEIEKGRRQLEHIIYELRKETGNMSPVYDPLYAMANFVMGRSYSMEFRQYVLKENRKSLREKCRLLLDAQKHYLRTIRSGIMYWSNAAAWEAGELYYILFRDMKNHPVPEKLSDEEKEVYICELWERISVLLRKSRRILKRSISIADNMSVANEYTEKSYARIVEINRMYNEQEKKCSESISSDLRIFPHRETVYDSGRVFAEDGTIIRYRHRGTPRKERPFIVFTEKASFLPVLMETLENFFEIVYLEGFIVRDGRKARGQKDYIVAEHLDYLQKLIDELNSDKPIIIISSVKYPLGMEFAAANPEKKIFPTLVFAENYEKEQKTKEKQNYNEDAEAEARLFSWKKILDIFSRTRKNRTVIPQSWEPLFSGDSDDEIIRKLTSKENETTKLMMSAICEDLQNLDKTQNIKVFIDSICSDS